MSKKKGGNDDCRDCMKGSFIILGTGAVITFIMCGGMSRGNMHSVYGQIFKILGFMFVSIILFAIVMKISPACVNFFTRRCSYILGVCQRIRNGLYENVQQLHDAIRGAEISTAEISTAETLNTTLEIINQEDQPPQAYAVLTIPYVDIVPFNSENEDVQVQVQQRLGACLCLIRFFYRQEIATVIQEPQAIQVEIQTTQPIQSV
jgi:hypothetical protein